MDHERETIEPELVDEVLEVVGITRERVVEVARFRAAAEARQVGSYPTCALEERPPDPGADRVSVQVEDGGTRRSVGGGPAFEPDDVQAGDLRAVFGYLDFCHPATSASDVRFGSSGLWRTETYPPRHPGRPSEAGAAKWKWRGPPSTAAPGREESRPWTLTAAAPSVSRRRMARSNLIQACLGG